eukprot:TRINITY_DN12982_c0_g1_i3.p1 TRINITY_DN12982_c0_g1~~TRINITY_DN12982_c0_g1_i3.p1  ORF type:complete len:192 (+),score=7.83 TRINITY_DN12982_c0_g1_i3:66-641(+)
MVLSVVSHWFAGSPLEDASADRDVELGRSPESDSEGAGDEVARVFQARTARPLMLEFVVPPNCAAGELISLAGPFGRPVPFTLPAGVRPGDRVATKLGPPGAVTVTVPDGAYPGQKVTVQRQDGSRLDVVIPAGLAPGATFDVSPPGVLVEVPRGAMPGDFVELATPRLCRRKRTVLPEGCRPGDVLAVAL